MARPHGQVTPAAVFILACMLGYTLAHRFSIDKVSKLSFDMKSSLTDENLTSVPADVDDEDAEGYGTSQDRSTVPTAELEAAKKQEQVENAAMKQADGNGKSCCMMLMLPKYRDPVEDSCTMNQLKTITYTDASNREFVIDLDPSTTPVVHAFGKKNPQQLRFQWAVEPYGKTPVDKGGTTGKLLGRERVIKHTLERVCSLKSCPQGYSEWKWSPARHDTEHSSHIKPSKDLAVGLELDIAKRYHTRKSVTIECYSTRFKVNGSKWTCPTGLSDSWLNCR